MRLQVCLSSEAHDTPHDFLIFTNTDMILVARLPVLKVNLFIRTPVVDWISDADSDTRLLEQHVPLVTVGVLAHFLQPFLSVRLATDKVDTSLFKQTNYTNYSNRLLVIKMRHTMAWNDDINTSHSNKQTNKQQKILVFELLMQVKQTNKLKHVLIELVIRHVLKSSLKQN